MKYAFYDFSVSPYSYDFVQFYVCALANGFEKVVFVPGRRIVQRVDGSWVEFQKCSPEEQAFRMEHLLKPLCDAPIVASTREEAKSYWSEDCFPSGYTIDKPIAHHTVGHVMFGGKMKAIGAKRELIEKAKSEIGEDTVLITIRDNPINPKRNCRVSDWIEAARWIKGRGYTPVFIPDTAKPDADFDGFRSLPDAAMDSGWRLALYSVAMLNVGINTGPLALCLYSKRPLLYFKPVNEKEYATQASSWARWGIKPGTQPPWFTKRQRIVWEPEDDSQTIVKYVGSWIDEFEQERMAA